MVEFVMLVYPNQKNSKDIHRLHHGHLYGNSFQMSFSLRTISLNDSAQSAQLIFQTKLLSTELTNILMSQWFFFGSFEGHWVYENVFNIQK